MNSNLKERISAVKKRIDQACAKVGRDPSLVRLVAVSKKKPAEMIRAAYELGLRDFGENYAQDLQAKAEALNDLRDIRWHFIGKLQRNKARSVAQIATLIHSVHSQDLVEKLDHICAETGPLSILVQLNISEEDSKSGIAPDALPSLMEKISVMPNLTCVGLMTIPPPVDDSEQVRPIFRQMRIIRDKLAAKHPQLTQLSMGMTDDLEVAIQEGATLVRVGTAIFGPRE
ncbi:MAG: YggS family pyridoxal phosphate-dependent enzyme [Pseudomonadota bacterium]